MQHIAPPDAPAAYHITQWKAGSQWVQSVLGALEPGRLYVPPMAVSDGIEFEPVETGRIYSPLYINRLRFDESPLAAARHRRFVVIRDLRDIVVSWYFSLLKTHDENPAVLMHRARLRELDQEEGMLSLVRHDDFYGLTMVASTWLEAGDTLIVRFESMIEDPEKWFARICEECGIEVERSRLLEVLQQFSFENLSGRPRGTDGPPSHYRRGQPGDWRRHFTPRICDEFQTRYDDLVMKCGYERTKA